MSKKIATTELGTGGVHIVDTPPVVIPLPTAAAAPVTQYPRRGPYPRGVASLPKYRRHLACLAYQREELTKKLRQAEEFAALSQMDMQTFVNRGARLRNEIAALAEKEVRHV